MAIRSTAARRSTLMGVAVAGALAGATGTASAQYYLYDDAPYLEQRFGYGYGYRYVAPRPPAPIPQRAISRIAARDFGLAQVDRTIATGSTYVVDGRTRSGARIRLILDPYSGQELDRIVLQPPPRQAPRVARVEPREETRPRPPRLTPQPPERPPALKPPGQAAAPATATPPSPAAPPRAEPAPAPAKPPAEASAPATATPPSPAAPPRSEPAPAPKPPAEASAPATQIPPTPAAPAAPGPGTTDPATGAEKPRLVNPTDVRGTEGGERTPPLARTEQPGIPAPLPPVQPQDTTSSQPKPETPAVPVTPME